MATEEVTFKYSKICADDSDETHFKDEEVDLTEADYAPPAPPVWVGPKGTATGVLVLVFPPGWYGDFHPAPKAQWMMVMTGSIEVEVSDGEKRTYTAGTPNFIAFVDDRGSKGHISRVVGDEPLVIGVIEVD